MVPDVFHVRNHPRVFVCIPGMGVGRCGEQSLVHSPPAHGRVPSAAQWFSEMGIAPVGNTDPVQRAMWEKAVDAGSISERGKAAAAQSKAKTLLQMMVDRGLKEEVRACCQ